MTDTPVSADTVVAIYKEKLSEANHRIVMLQAAIIGLETDLEKTKEELKTSKELVDESKKSE